MRALQSHAGTTRPTLEDVDAQPPASDEIRVRVTASAVNPADIAIASGSVREAFGLPATVGLGWDVAGTVTEIGSAVDEFAVGDRVAALHDDPSAPVRAHAEFVTVPAAAAAPVPDGLDLRDAASVPLNALTAAQALDLLGDAGGRSLLVTGAAGAVGGYAVALAVRAGWRVSGLARSEDERFVRDAGATDFVTAVPGPSYDAVLDTAALQQEAITAVHDQGAFVGVLPPQPVLAERGITVSVVGVQADGNRLRALLELANTGVLAIRVAGETSLDDAQSAYDKVAGGGQRGRWLVV